MPNTIKSQLGNIHIEKDNFHRKKKGNWENILEKYPEQKIIDQAHYSQITGLKLQTGSIHPCIKIQNDNNWKYLFLQINDPIRKCWKQLRYRWQTYQQNH